MDGPDGVCGLGGPNCVGEDCDTCPHFSTSDSTYVPDAPFVANFDCDNLSVSIRPESGSSGIPFDRGYFVFSDLYPVNGYYTLLDGPSLKGYSVSSSGDRVEYSRSFVSGNTVFYEAAEKYSYSLEYSGFGSSRFISVRAFFPVYKVTPLEAVDTTPSGEYGINSRPTVIDGGNYGIVGDNGQITTVTNHNQIINETNNTYYNPATGQTQAITDWTYNYDGRIYDITLDTGDKVSVEYGDNNITITENTVNEGDTIVNNYTIYYIVDGGGENPGPSPTPGPPACPHEWYKTGERQPTCLIPAQRTYTCSICGEQTC